MLQSSEHIGTYHTYDYLNGSNDDNNVLIQEANDLCEEIGDLVDSIYTNFAAQENAGHNDPPFGSRSYNYGSNRSMSNFSCCKNTSHCNVLANELMRKQIEKEKLVYCNDKLDEIRGMLESFGEPEQTIRRSGTSWEIDENYLQQFQLKLNIENQQEMIKEKLSKADKLKLSDYYNLHFNKSRSNTSPEFNTANSNDEVPSRLMTSPWSSNVNSNYSVPTRVDTSMTHNMGSSGQFNGKSNTGNYSNASGKTFGPSQSSSGSMLNHGNSGHLQSCYPNDGFCNLYRTNMVGRYNKDGTMMYVRGTMKLNPGAPQNKTMCPSFQRFNVNKHSKPMMTRKTMSGLSVPYSVRPSANYGAFGRMMGSSSDFSKINHSNSSSTCYSNSFYGENDNAVISSIGTHDDGSGVVSANCMGLSSVGGATGKCMGRSSAGGASGGVFRGCFGANVGSKVSVPTNTGDGPAVSRASTRMGVAGSRSMSQFGSRSMGTKSFGPVGGSQNMGTSSFKAPSRNPSKVHVADSGMGVGATSSHGTDNGAGNNNATSNKEESQYYEFETIDDLMEYENDEYYCDSMGPLPQFTNSNDELIDKLFEGNEPNAASTPLAMPYVKGGSVSTPIHTRVPTSRNSTNNTTNNSTNNPSSPIGPKATGSRFVVDRSVSGGEKSDVDDGTTVEMDKDNNKEEKECKHFYYYKIYNSNCSDGKRGSTGKKNCHHGHRHHRRHSHCSHHHRSKEYEEDASIEPENTSFENSIVDDADIPQFSPGKPQRKGTVKVGGSASRDDTVYKARVICPSVQ
ncbi:hypothetical protein MACJ_001586 [Theileria orientalis]|uniref:Uncharacterized protein n=1 Tax=Theileria orientalis TaxID=68886 RepID=A0A976QTJ2_THEOR|nr:hypothetical protein MACJ_001586 [Theileria orientalis]